MNRIHNHRTPQTNTAQLPLLSLGPTSSHKPSSKSGSSTKANGDASKKDSTKDDSKKDDKKATPANDNATPDAAATFTSEQDAKILKMKGENKSWKIIADELGTFPARVKGRFKELNDKAGTGAGGDTKKDEAKKEETKDDEKKDAQQGGKQGKQSKKDKKREWQEQQKEKHKPDHQEAKKEEQKEEPKCEQARPARSVAASSTSGWFELEEDDNFSFGELQMLVSILDADMGRVWDRVASAFFDKTGRRIAPCDVKQKMRRSARARSTF